MRGEHGRDPLTVLAGAAVRRLVEQVPRGRQLAAARQQLGGPAPERGDVQCEQLVERPVQRSVLERVVCTNRARSPKRALRAVAAATILAERSNADDGPAALADERRRYAVPAADLEDTLARRDPEHVDDYS